MLTNLKMALTNCNEDYNKLVLVIFGNFSLQQLTI